MWCQLSVLVVQTQSTFALRDESTNERMEVPWALLDLIRYEYEKEKIKAAMEVDMTNDDKLPPIHRNTSLIGKHNIQVPANLDAAHQLYLQKMAQVQMEMAKVKRLKVMMARCCQLINETI
ncbi:hypothetical protein BDN71DRAFT_1456757 [Pleurotus eryngii]|uniref:Uncharacterized protein n=1 Tax=Pleurotus eryngii TaxID=5323 RepID=A0A9P5ZMB1_PLEER|nr:hypothetical protein BDN71DRAFT_1456757 [Pleurotus eryngii]